MDATKKLVSISNAAKEPTGITYEEEEDPASFLPLVGRVQDVVTLEPTVQQTDIIPRLPAEPVVDNIADITDEEILMTQAIANLNTEEAPRQPQHRSSLSAADAFINQMQGRPFNFGAASTSLTASSTWDGSNNDLSATTLNVNDDIIDITKYRKKHTDVIGNAGRNLKMSEYQRNHDEHPYQASTTEYVPMSSQPAFTIGRSPANSTKQRTQPSRTTFSRTSGYGKYYDEDDDDNGGLAEAVDTLHDKVDEVYDTTKCVDRTCTEITEMLSSIGDISEDVHKGVKEQYKYLVQIAQNDSAVKAAVGSQLTLIHVEISAIKAEQLAQRQFLEKIIRLISELAVSNRQKTDTLSQ